MHGIQNSNIFSINAISRGNSLIFFYKKWLLCQFDSWLIKLKLFSLKMALSEKNCYFEYKKVVVSKVIIEKSCGEVSLMGQETIENYS